MYVIKAKDLNEGTHYIHINNRKEIDMGILKTKGNFQVSGHGNHEPSATLAFENGGQIYAKVYDWDENFKVKTTSGGKRKSRRNRKSKKSRKSKSKKNSRKSNRRRL